MDPQTTPLERRRRTASMRARSDRAAEPRPPHGPRRHARTADRRDRRRSRSSARPSSGWPSPGRGTATVVPARPRSTPSGRSPGAGTRRSSTRSAARSRTRRSTPGTCSTPRSRCGTPGRPTTRPPAATSSRRSTRASNVGRGAQRGDQLRRLPGPDVALHQGRRRRRVAVRVRRRDGHPVLSARRRRRPRATRRPRSATASRRRSSPTASTDGSNQANGYAAPDYKPVNPPLVVAKSGDHDDRPEPLAAAPARAHDLARTGSRSRTASSRRSGRTGATSRASRSRPAGDDGVPIDPGPPPRLGDPATDQAYKDQAVEVIRDSSRARPGRRRDDRHLARRPRRQHARHATTARATRSTRPPASRTRRTWSSRATSPGP